ncbi:hypothetical protein AB2B41_05720 [Marimonas sp. MJW-29]|uniref:Uncharacterized protein n=1 Tax=Sulfitobacter sediminis TaxID=3234186 RepID=A0ABV3RL59_9RHOB
MFRKTAKNGKLVITAIACCVDPTGLGIVAASADAAIHASEEWLKKRPDLTALAKEIDKAFAKEIDKPYYGKPNDVRLLLTQMLEAAFPNGNTVAKASLEPSLILTEMKSNLTDKEHLKPENWAAFETAFLPLLERACDDPRLVAALQPSLIRHDGEWKRGIDTKLDMIVDAVQQNQNLPALARELARQEKLIFRIAGSHLKTRSDDPLEVLQDIELALEAYAANAGKTSNFGADFDDTVRQLDAILIESGLAAAKNALAAAEDDALQMEEAVKAKRLMLLDKRVAFAQLDNDPTTAATAEIESFEIENSRPPFAQEIVDIAIEKERRFERFGTSFDGYVAISLLEKALEIAKPEDQPDIIVGQLGNASGKMGERHASSKLLAKAVFWYREHARQVPKSLLPYAWATTQNNLGNALSEQGTRTGGPEGADLLAEAVTAYRAALDVFTRDDHPVESAMTQNNLGSALKDQGARTDGAKGADLLAQAVTAYHAALEVRTHADHPVDRAMTQENIAIAQLEISEQDSCTDPAAALDAAVIAVDAALTVYDPDHMSYDHAKATRLRDEILAARDALTP